MDRLFDIEDEFVHLARIALAGRTQDVQTLLLRAARRAGRGAPKVADALLDLLKKAPTRSSPLRRQSEVPMPVDTDTRLQLMKVEHQPVLQGEPIFVASVEGRLKALVAERRAPHSLRAVGLEPARTALFVGLPGVGKTLAARWLARELNLPLLTLDLAAVMSSYLGRTGGNLRLVLDYAKSMNCVLLLDELDAVAKRRDDQGEIGELKRLVTVLIQELDDWPASNLLIAATNHPGLLDPAIWRRFDETIEFPLPDVKSIRLLVEEILKGFVRSSRDWAQVLSFAFEGLSFSEVSRSIASARRKAATLELPLEECLGSLIRVGKLSKQTKIDLAVSLVEKGILSARKVQEMTGVARDTIRARTNEGKRAEAESEINT